MAAADGGSHPQRLTERAHYAQQASLPGRDALLQAIQRTLQTWTAPTLQAVINAAGVILHTNLGRAPLSQAALLAVQNVSQGYSTLEYDLKSGKRGSRLVHAEALLTRLTGAQAALVVNNSCSSWPDRPGAPPRCGDCPHPARGDRRRVPCA
jgi:L-seryl-tRNA(Ser) seleniumtransferase